MTPLTVRQPQIDRLKRLLAEVVPANPFYARKLAAAGVSPDDIRAPADLARLPFTCKAEFAADQATHPPYGTNLTYPPDRYARLHQTSGTTTGRPLRWLDTAASWAAWHDVWRVYFTEFFGLTPCDRLLFPFSFGPFLGFWTAFEAASRMGFFLLPAGGMPTATRLRYLLDHGATVLFATPTYALHMAEVAEKEGIDLPNCPVRAIVVAGEPGGGIPATRARIEAAWGGRVFDHYGLTEVGPAAVEAADDPGFLYANCNEFVAEVLEHGGSAPVGPGEDGELVLTNLGRAGMPVVRYRTGDVVRVAADPGPTSLAGRGWLRLDGGVRGRTDDMIHVRGNNLYPTAIEAVVRRFPEAAEYRVVVDETGPLADLRIEVEPTDPAAGPRLCDAIGKAIRDALLFRADVAAVPPGTLPRFEMKARRTVRHRGTENTETTTKSRQET